MNRPTLIKGGTVLTMDPTIEDLRNGDVLIEDGLIVEVGRSLEAADADVIDASDMVVMPGLVDGHTHLWYGAVRSLIYGMGFDELVSVAWARVGSQVTPDDIYRSIYGNIASAIDAGVTSICDFFHAANSHEHGDAAIQAHRDSPLRAVFGYGPSITKKLEELAGQSPADEDWSNAARAQNEIFASDPRRKLALAISGPDTTSVEETGRDVEFARDLGVPITVHVAAREGLQTGGVMRMAQAELLGPDVQFVHCCATSADEFRLIVEAGAHAAWAPTAEIAVGLGYPPTARAEAAGVPAAFGTDSVSCTSGGLFEEARAGLLLDRAQRAARRYVEYRPTESAAELGLSATQALEAVTQGAADAIWLGDTVGSLTPGKRADVILVRAGDLNLAPFNRAAETLVSCAHSGNVDTVLIDGEVVKRDGRLTWCDPDQVAADLRATAKRLLGAADSLDQMVPSLPV